MQVTSHWPHTAVTQLGPRGVLESTCLPFLPQSLLGLRAGTHMDCFC